MEKIKNRQKLSWQGMFYTVQRLDLLIISISGAGIYVSLEALKFLKENKMETSYLIKVSGFILLLAIVLNFVSQILAYWSNYYDYLYCDEKLDKKPKNEDYKIYEKKSDCYNLWNIRLNLASALAMFLGLISLLSFFIVTF